MSTGRMSTFWKIILIILAIILIAFIFWWIMQSCSPPLDYYQEGQQLTNQPLFYTGDVRIESIEGIIQLEPARRPTAPTLNVTLRNDGPLTEFIEVTFGRPTNISTFLQDTLRSGVPVQRSIPIPVEFDWFESRQDSLKETRILLSAYNYDLPFGTAAEGVNIEILPPRGVNGLVSSSIPLEARRQGSGVRYFLNEIRWTPMDLKVFHTTYGVTLLIHKTVSIVPNTNPQEYLIHLDITNLGPGDASNISLRDDYDPRFFQGIGADFNQTSHKKNEGWLYWTHIISGPISIGESEQIDYTVQARRDLGSTWFQGTAAYIGKEIVGTSNKVLYFPPP